MSLGSKSKRNNDREKGWGVRTLKARRRRIWGFQRGGVQTEEEEEVKK